MAYLETIREREKERGREREREREREKERERRGSPAKVIVFMCKDLLKVEVSRLCAIEWCFTFKF